MRMRILVLVLIAAVAVAVAQTKAKAGSAKAQKPAASAMTVPQGEEMKRLEKALAGNWTLDEKFDPMPGVPGMDKGGVGKGKETIKRGPGGHSLVQELNSSSSMGPFQGHGVTWWDARVNAYRSVWCDSSAAWCDTSMTGKFEGEDLVFEGDSDMPAEMGGGKMHMVQRFAGIKPG